jgi:biopolymer transport protein ExbD
MRIPPRHDRSHDFGAMTSMIDVVLFLLMFFVITAGTGDQALLLPTPLARSGSIDSPQAGATSGESKVEITLRLKWDTQAGRTVVDMNGTDYADLAALQDILHRLARLDAGNPVVFSPAPDVPLGDLITLYDTCQAAGFDTIQFSARSPAP